MHRQRGRRGTRAGTRGTAGPSFAPKDRPLREDVRVLGALLGDVLKEQGPAGLFERVEAVRLAARARRAGDSGAERRLSRLLAGLSIPQALALVRAFSAYFFVVNMAERIHRMRRALDYRAGGRVQPGGWEAALRRVARAGTGRAALRRLLARLEVTPVFTAHPTEAMRRSLLVKEQRIARALMDRLSPENDPDALMARVRAEITAAWQTEEQLSERPAVADEVEHIVFYLSEVIYRVIPGLYADLAGALESVFGTGAHAVPVPVFLSFASWVGGDMDGNPNVGPDTIRATLRRHRELCLRKYRDEVRELFGFLTQSTSLVAVDRAVLRRCTAYRRRMPGVFAEIPSRYHEMPYRILLWFIARRLEAGAAERPGGYAQPQELLADLRLILRSLARNRGEHAGARAVQRLERRVETFGFHLAALDVRQHASVHRGAVGEVLGVRGFAALPAAERTQRLEALLRGAVRAPARPRASTRRTLAVLREIAAARRTHGERSVGLLIISMAQGPDDALAVLALARAAGAVDGARVPIDVTPLFETVDDLAGARRTLESLWTHPAYRRHLRARGTRQYVMLGYSDSNKDGGLAASRWALHNAQIGIVAAARRHRVDVTLFHGRGGSISRGGGRPREAILAEPPGALAGRLRVTEQGEIIHAKYGLRGLAVRTLELMGGAVLEGSAVRRRTAEPAAWREAMAQVAAASREHYRSLVYGNPEFPAYFREATPIDVIERVAIGSRPSRRSGQAGIEDLRAIPWVFAWTQSRHLLPGWFGIGAGLEAAERAGGLRVLRRMASSWAFFDNLLSDAEMTHAKADLDIARRYAALSRAGPRIFPRIEEEYDRTREMIVRVRGTRQALGGDPVLRRALWLRNPYVDPMSFVQVDLLRRWRGGGRRDAALERALVATVHGIARGMQNTG